MGSAVAAAIVWMHSGLHAVYVAGPVFLMATGIWIAIALPFALYRFRKGRLTGSTVIAYAAASSVLAATVFFVLFVYFLMFCLPVAFFVAALTFNRIALKRGSPKLSTGGAAS